jgi:hypothetical protein
VVIAVLLYGIQLLVGMYTESTITITAVGLVLFMGYVYFIFKMEKKEFSQLPVIGKLVARI